MEEGKKKTKTETKEKRNKKWDERKEEQK